MVLTTSVELLIQSNASGPGEVAVMETNTALQVEGEISILNALQHIHVKTYTEPVSWVTVMINVALVPAHEGRKYLNVSAIAEDCSPPEASQHCTRAGVLHVPVLMTSTSPGM